MVVGSAILQCYSRKNMARSLLSICTVARCKRKLYKWRNGVKAVRAQSRSLIHGISGYGMYVYTRWTTRKYSIVVVESRRTGTLRQSTQWGGFALTKPESNDNGNLASSSCTVTRLDLFSPKLFSVAGLPEHMFTSDPRLSPSSIV